MNQTKQDKLEKAVMKWAEHIAECNLNPGKYKKEGIVIQFKPRSIKRYIGDEIKIKTKLTNRMYDFVPDMRRFAGQETFVVDMVDYDDGSPIVYDLEVDGGEFAWTEEYFE
jgi:hypothetical protein